MLKGISRILFLAVLAVSLTACVGAYKRDSDAATAKAKMRGLTKEEVLACMGPPKKKAAEEATEVWSYASGSGRSVSSRTAYKPTHWFFSDGASEKRFCTVNVVMRNGIVTAVHYLGPASSYFTTDYDQCGYAVAACVDSRH